MSDWIDLFYQGYGLLVLPFSKLERVELGSVSDLFFFSEQRFMSVSAWLSTNAEDRLWTSDIGQRREPGWNGQERERGKRKAKRGEILLTTCKISPPLTPKEGLILSLQTADLGRRTSDRTGHRASEFGVRSSDVGLYFEQSRPFLCLHCAIHITFPRLWIPPERWHPISKLEILKFYREPHAPVWGSFVVSPGPPPHSLLFFSFPFFFLSFFLPFFGFHFSWRSWQSVK